MVVVLALFGGLAVLAFVPVQVSGQAVDVEGRPVAQVQADMMVSGQDEGTTHGDGNGHFAISGARRVVPYHVVLTAPGYAPAIVSGSTVVMHRLPRMQGRVVDDQGNGVPSATLTLTRAGESILWSLQADPDGFFLLNQGLTGGNFKLTVEAADHEAVVQPLRLEEDHVQQVNPILKRLLGSLAITTDPPGLQPLLDQRPLSDCPSTPCTVEVPVGAHLLSFESDLYVPWQTTTNLHKGEKASLSTKLERKTGTLVLQAPAAADADLEVDGTREPAPTWTGQVPTGDHVVTFRSSAFWPASANTHLDWKQTTNLTINAVPVTPGDRDGFVRGLQGYLAALGGSPGNQYAIYMQDLGSGSELGSNENALMEAASVIKVPVALYVYKQAEDGKINLDDQVTLQDQDFMGGTGSLYGTAHTGDKFSYRDLVALMIQQSDNTAWKALNHALGADKVDAYAGTIGAPDCDQWVDNCSPREMGAVLAGLARGKLLNSDDTKSLIHLLETTIFNDRINYYLGGAAIAHKVGMDGGVMNDAGIVYLNGSPFVVVVFTTTDNPAAGVQVIRDVARAGAHYFGH